MEQWDMAGERTRSRAAAHLLGRASPITFVGAASVDPFASSAGSGSAASACCKVNGGGKRQRLRRGPRLLDVTPVVVAHAGGGNGTEDKASSTSSSNDAQRSQSDSDDDAVEKIILAAKRISRSSRSKQYGMPTYGELPQQQARDIQRQRQPQQLHHTNASRNGGVRESDSNSNGSSRTGGRFRPRKKLAPRRDLRVDSSPVDGPNDSDADGDWIVTSDNDEEFTEAEISEAEEDGMTSITLEEGHADDDALDEQSDSEQLDTDVDDDDECVAKFEGNDSGSESSRSRRSRGEKRRTLQNGGAFKSTRSAPAEDDMGTELASGIGDDLEVEEFDYNEFDFCQSSNSDDDERNGDVERSSRPGGGPERRQSQAANQTPANVDRRDAPPASASTAPSDSGAWASRLAPQRSWSADNPLERFGHSDAFVQCPECSALYAVDLADLGFPIDILSRAGVYRDDKRGSSNADGRSNVSLRRSAAAAAAMDQSIEPRAVRCSACIHEWFVRPSDLIWGEQEAIVALEAASKQVRSAISAMAQKHKTPIDMEQPEPLTIFARNVSFKANVQDLNEAFGAFGRVVRCEIPCDRLGSPRGFAFIEMARKADAQRAIRELDGVTWFNRRLHLSVAEPRPAQVPPHGGSSESRDAGQDADD
ncbi:putative RNA-binding protein RbpE [Porphyridium purpureum]|uniref:Putative RNA-binding protein RbpE n=1 Tax=Porphyridium purpureum TaxID=35688 RepID=A0A5J4Z1B0_PORPP|nr:putative RNA-binding protein RbpE [Porphyridium purpureum]|eukprot:POR4325..scf208_2